MALRYDYASGEMYDDGEPDYPDEPSGYDFGADPTNPYGIYSNRGEDTLSAMGVADDTAPGVGDQAIGAARGLFGDKTADLLKTYGPKLFDFATSKGGMAGIAALLGMLGRQKASGGGAGMGIQAPRQYSRAVDPKGIVRYAAEGGLMHAYANGGKVQMEDGGFVLTKRAVDGAGGPRGIQQLVPGARMIRGPGTGTSDEIPAVINGQNGQTPARLSNGEAYVPRGAVRDQGGPQRMYALMNNLQRKA